MTVTAFLISLTFGSATEHNINPPKYLDGFCNSSAALAHDPAITPDGADPILPSLTIFAVALTLVDELTKFGAAVLVLDLLWRQACDYIVTMCQELAY